MGDLPPSQYIASDRPIQGTLSVCPAPTPHLTPQPQQPSHQTQLQHVLDLSQDLLDLNLLHQYVLFTCSGYCFLTLSSLDGPSMLSYLTPIVIFTQFYSSAAVPAGEGHSLANVSDLCVSLTDLLTSHHDAAGYSCMVLNPCESCSLFMCMVSYRFPRVLAV